ncbi:MAG TPA: DUF4394 domain-containing protein [Thermoleophilaceae bacterium]
MSGRLLRGMLAAAAVGLLAPATAGAERAAGINGDLNLVLLDTATPAGASFQIITGLQTAGERAIALDTRPATGELFLVTTPKGVLSGSTVITRSYRLDPETAVATFVAALPGGTPPSGGDWQTGADFNPVVDRLRLVNANNENFRINPNSGVLSGDDPNLTFVPPATGPVTAEAYDRNVAPGPPGTVAPPGTQTTLYGIDVGADRLVVQGGINGSGPGGANGGSVANVGALGVAVDNSSDAGFDITPGGTAYAALRTSTVPNLYTVDLQSGTATALGQLPAELRSLTILPPDTRDIDGDGVIDLADACPTIAAPAPSGCPIPALPPDVTDPTLSVAGVPGRVSRKRFFNGIPARISAGETVRLEVALLVKARAIRIARIGDVVLAERNLGLSAAQRRVRLKPRRRLVGRARRFTARLRVIATDAAGNRTAVVKRIRVQQPAKR